MIHRILKKRLIEFSWYFFQVSSTFYFCNNFEDNFFATCFKWFWGKNQKKKIPKIYLYIFLEGPLFCDFSQLVIGYYCLTAITSIIGCRFAKISTFQPIIFFSQFFFFTLKSSETYPKKMHQNWRKKVSSMNFSKHFFNEKAQDFLLHVEIHFFFL